MITATGVRTSVIEPFPADTPYTGTAGEFCHGSKGGKPTEEARTLEKAILECEGKVCGFTAANIDHGSSEPSNTLRQQI